MRWSDLYGITRTELGDLPLDINEEILVLSSVPDADLSLFSAETSRFSDTISRGFGTSRT